MFLSVVRDLMTEKMTTVKLETSIDQSMGLMNQYRIRHLPVTENNKMVGVISMRDQVDVLISERESTIKGLRNYILI
jgi:CBS domain-containing protein